MKKNFILSMVLNLAIIFLIMSGVAAYKSGNMLILGLSIAIGVVLIYLKVVLIKFVNRDLAKRQQEKLNESKLTKTSKKK